jgi:hypothetical protein
MADKKIDAKHLAGLTFRGADQKEVEEEGRKKLVSTPFTRDLTPADVLDWVDKGDAVSFVTADGQKHLVSKKPAKAEEKA